MKQWKKAVLCVIIILVMALPRTVCAIHVPDSTGAEEFSYVAQGNGYDAFLQTAAYAPAGGESILLSENETVEDGNGRLGLKFTFVSSNSGRYALKLSYFVENEDTRVIERRVEINGAVPYDELKSVILPREYTSGEICTDIGGNELRPEQVAAHRMTTNYVFDHTGKYSDPLSINIEYGENVLVIWEVTGAATIHQVELVPADSIRSYEEVLKTYAGIPVYDGEAIQLEAEDASYVSDSTIYPIGDKSSPLVSPAAADRILINTIGGYRWQEVHQYISWIVNVPNSGLYSLSFKVRQNTKAGERVNRALYINGEIPFKEVSAMTVDFSNQWQLLIPGDEQGDYLFYLEQGENELRLQVTLGELDQILRALDNSLQNLNAIYRKFLLVIGASPDTARDYKLDQLLPEQIAQLGKEADRLEYYAKWMENYHHSKSSGIALIDVLVSQLREMHDDPDTIAGNFTYFKTNLGSLGTWLSEARKQPLQMDNYFLSGKTAERPKVNAGFFPQVWFKVQEFFYSFIIDYQSVGNLTESTDDPLLVWIASGRDQAQIIQNMIRDDFTPKTGISVSLQLVSGGALLPSTVAGIGPDVNIGGADVINFAMRNAVKDLSSFPDYEKIAERFAPAAFIPLTYNGGVYGIPETMSFSVLFYRKDILEELKLTVPTTWSEVLQVSTVLAKNKMEFGIPSGGGGFLLFVKQSGLEVYENHGQRCLLDSTQAVNLLRYYTNFFLNHGFPLSYDFLNRFRSGEMPIGVADFNMYATLQLSAPEIHGLWDFALLPGMMREDGTVDHSSLISGAASIILADSDRDTEAWEFLKWYTSADVQVKYGREIESRLGTSARYSSANLDAFARSEWSDENLQLLQQQLQMTTAIEQVPGGYYLSRHLENSFRNIVYSGKDPLDMQYDYVYKINCELEEKRKEFGLE